MLQIFYELFQDEYGDEYTDRIQCRVVVVCPTQDEGNVNLFAMIFSSHPVNTYPTWIDHSPGPLQPEALGWDESLHIEGTLYTQWVYERCEVYANDPGHLTNHLRWVGHVLPDLTAVFEGKDDQDALYLLLAHFDRLPASARRALNENGEL